MLALLSAWCLLIGLVVVSGPTSAGAADEFFGYALGDVVSDGVPSAGAGNIETPGSTDTYSFTGTAGQSVYFDALAGSGTLADWSVTAPSSAVVFDSSGFFDRGPFVLPESGVYTLVVVARGTDDGALQLLDELHGG